MIGNIEGGGWQIFPRPEGAWCWHVALHAGREAKLWVGDRDSG